MSAAITSERVAVSRPGRSRTERGLFRARELSETTVLVAAVGEIDAANSGELRTFIENHLRGYQQLVLDLSRLDFFGTDGFSALHTINVRCSRCGIDWVMVPGPEVGRLLDWAQYTEQRRTGMAAPGRNYNDVVTRFWSLAAPLYDLPFLQQWVYRPAQEEVLAQLRAHGARRIADIACGTGILAARIAAELHPGQVYGVDMSDGMLRQARARSADVQWLKSPAEQLPFDDASLDAVVTTSAFHFFDQPAAMREFHRVLRSGGLVAVATISPPPPPLLRRLSSNPSNPSHSPSPQEMRVLFADAGFALSDQHRVHRPLWTKPVWDLITIGTKP